MGNFRSTKVFDGYSTVLMPDERRAIRPRGSVRAIREIARHGNLMQ